MYVNPVVERGLKVSLQFKGTAADLLDVRSIRSCINLKNLAISTQNLTKLTTTIGTNSNLSDLDESTELIQVLQKDKLEDLAINL